MFIRYLYVNVYTWGREEGSFSDEQPELCWWEPTMSEGHWVWSYQVSNPASLPSLCHPSGKGPKKDGQETPGLPLSSLVLLAPGVPAATKSSCCHCPISPRAHMCDTKGKLQESPNDFCGGSTCSSQGEIGVVAVFNWDIQSLLSFYFACASIAIPG